MFSFHTTESSLFTLNVSRIDEEMEVEEGRKQEDNEHLDDQILPKCKSCHTIIILGTRDTSLRREKTDTMRAI